MAVITDTKARNLKPEDKPIPHGIVTGLALHPSSKRGKGKWVLRFLSPQTQKRRNAGLGIYPDVSIAEAGKLANAMREQIASGVDPLELLHAEKIVIPSFETAARTVHAELLPGWKNEKHGHQWLTTLEKHVFPYIGSVLLSNITAANVATVLRPLWLSRSETARRTKQRIHTVMAWGWAHGYCSANPVDVVSHLLPQQTSASLRRVHQPAMPWKNIPLFIATHLDRKEKYDVSRAILTFVILTACRSGEAREMRWSEVDFQKCIWTIPAEKMKASVQHRVPLSNQAMAVLNTMRWLHKDLVFPSPRKQIVLSDMALTSFLRRVEAESDVPGRVATAHGFRSSFRDWCSEHGYPRDLAERALAHTVQNKVEAAYHRTDLLEQRRPMMQAWADYVMSNTL
ncbi:tyrosine-type recombinase/integrase [Citrobacter portucalensis]|uniref:tyrosine-type recombinase/integrase n=1 Tax=Citrobacter portucalensis TaxID=1639133 RepID=UPI0039F5A053